MERKGRSEKRPRITPKTGVTKKSDRFEPNRSASGYEDRPQRMRFDRKPHTDRLSEKEESEHKPRFENSEKRRKPGRPRKDEQYGGNKYESRDSRDFKRNDRKFDSKDDRKDNKRSDSRDFKRNDRSDSRDFKRSDRKSYSKDDRNDSRKNDRRSDSRDFKRNDRNFDSKNGSKRTYTKRTSSRSYERAPSPTGLIRLNKYLANSGVCSRREADELIIAGTVTVNGKIISELGFKVKPSDVVAYDGRVLRREKLRYVLLNKPKGFITTSDDPYERHTVMELVENACEERLYPVGRLDRNTVGLLLMTNDGDLAKKLTHPKHGVRKLYHVTLDKPLTKNDLLKISEGFDLEDGPVDVDSIAWVVDDSSKKEVGVELHSGKNRIVRRIFEHLGYEVVKLDRVMFAGLTKLGIERGRWRFLTDTEVGFLKKIK
ncbi:MAG: pseudouridine synthase [Lentimicrobiaceae bacterium]|jgi:23S rRNA pseudouridine2605 synthase|nr:pseudouridine synthase [Lentimicrobiaceae bacterium]